MKDFIEIQKNGLPEKLVNIYQIASVTALKDSLRLVMSNGETIYLQMPYLEFTELVNVVKTSKSISNKISVKIIN